MHLENQHRAPAWGAVFALSFGAFALVASEFLPVSLLTPIARDLHITEGQAGQGISVAGAFALVTSLFITAIAGRIDRKTILLTFTGIMIASGTLVALSPNYTTFMVARALVGIAIGGFWSMSAATAMRLVPLANVPQALAIVNGGNALATVIAAPLGSFLGSIIGWRGAFFFIVPVAALVFVWQAISLPPLKAVQRDEPGKVLTLLTRPVVALGMAAVSLFFMGQFSLFTYLRPFLETITRVDASSLSLILLLIGLAGFLGTTLIGKLIKKSVYKALVVSPFIMAAIALLLVSFGGGKATATVLLGFWGLIGTSAPVAWWTWLSRTLPNDVEGGGGLMVAVVQLAVTSGAITGGLLYDHVGYQATFGASAVMLVASCVLAVLTSRASSRE
ncbi:MAG: putative transport protein Major Facilitator Superfamily [Tardiphaga sp.]|nr:putative transport protein Major Facilitator Superfamily [Tardiphaga sp.]